MDVAILRQLAMRVHYRVTSRVDKSLIVFAFLRS